MGQKVNPTGFRLPVNRAWRSRWFAPKRAFAEYLVEDSKIREFVMKRLSEAGVSAVKPVAGGPVSGLPPTIPTARTLSG